MLIRLMSRGANSSFSDGQSVKSGSYERKRKSPSREDNEKDLKKVHMLPKGSKRRLLTYSRTRRNIIDNLPAVLLAEIISRLPLESILKSTKLVSKKWYQLTRDPNFIQLHLKRSKPISLFQPLQNSPYHVALVDNIEHMYFREVRKLSQIPVTKKISRQYIAMCSYNGLLCMAPRYHKADPLGLYNPLTRVFLELPKSRLNRVVSEYFVCLSSDSNGRYKILRHFTQKYGAKESRFEMLSLGDSSWRRINVLGGDWYARASLFCNGIFLMIMQKVGGFEMCFTAIDMNNEKIQVIHFEKVVRILPSVVRLMDVEGAFLATEIFNNEKICEQIIFGNKVGEFKILRSRASNYRERFKKSWPKIWLNGDKYLKQINKDEHFVIVDTRVKSSIEYKMFDYKPSFVNPIADALL